jgi:general secretion pathway protein K
MRGNRGFALVITLIVTALLVALVTEFIAEVYVDTTSKQSYVDGQKAGLMAESGVSGAIAMLQFSLSKKNYTSLHDFWAKPIDLPEEQGSLRVIVEDENARLSLNHISGANGVFISETDPSGSYYGSAKRFFTKMNLPASDLCDAIADWIDDNDIPKPGGAESQWYTNRKPSVQQQNRPFYTVEELALVKGFSSDVMEQIRPFVTVYGESSVAARVNVNTASKEVLMALDERITDSVAEQIIDHRKNTPFTPDKGLGSVPGLDSRIAQELSLRITNKSTIFRIRAEGLVNGTLRVVETVVSFAGGAPATLYWREY